MDYSPVTNDALIATVKNGYKRTKLFDVLYRFQKDEIGVAEVDAEGYKNVSSCTAALRASIKRFGFANLTATTVDGKCYLINKDYV